MKKAISIENDWSWPEERDIYGVIIVDVEDKSEIYTKEKEIHKLCKETEEKIIQSCRNKEKFSVREEIMKEFTKNMNKIGEYYEDKEMFMMCEKNFPEIYG